MADKAELLAEAYRRGLLPPDKRAAYEEAQRRGLVGRSPSFADDVGASVGGAWNKLKTDAADDFQRHKEKRSSGNLFLDAAEDTGRTGRMVGNLFGLAASPITGAIDAAVSKPASRALAKLPVKPYEQKTVRNMFEAPRQLDEEGAQQFYEGAINTAMSGVRAGPVKFGPPKPRPTAPMKPAMLKPAKDAAYAAVDSAGVKYKGSTFDGLTRVMETELAAASMNPMRHPKAASMLDDIRKMRGQQPTLTELDQLRQVIRRDVIQAGDQSEQRLGKIMLKQIDDFIDVAGPKQVVAGNPKAAASSIRTARDLNTRLRKVEAVEDAVESARLRAGSTGSGGNVDNATRQNLRRVLEDGNFTPDEAGALEKVVLGGHAQNFLRLIGKLSPNGNGLMTALNIGGAAANPLMAIPGMAGIFAKMGADAMTAKKVKDLMALIAAGGSKTALKRPIPSLPSARPAVGAATVANPFARQQSQQEARKAAQAGR